MLLKLLVLLHALVPSSGAAAAAAAPGLAAQCEEAPDLAEEAYALVQLRRLNAGGQISNPSVACPGSEAMCAGNQCCPGSNISGGRTFPCPTADPDFIGCEGFKDNPGVEKLAAYLWQKESGGRQSTRSCTLGRGESCPLSEMEGPTLVYPGGQTACLQGEYAFLVSPGDTDQLLFYFQGGGACWDMTSYMLGACYKSLAEATRGEAAALALGAGVFNRSEPRNLLRRHTFVMVLYCSGDAHAGNTSHYWNLTHLDQRQQQRGYHNTLATVEWVQANLPPLLTSLVVSGDSAGALGAQAWASLLLSEKFKYQRAVVIPDSYVGYFPEGTTSLVLQTWKVCELPIFDAVEQAACLLANFTFPFIMGRTMEKFPAVPFGYLQSKEDQVQMVFYDAVYNSYHFPFRTISGPEFYFGTNTLFEDYNKYPNFVGFYVDGATHTFTEAPWYYTAGTKGNSSGSAEGQANMTAWVNTFVAGAWENSECYGPSEPNNAESAEYCDASLVGKESTIR